MSPPPCPRLWEAEALEDKRLGDADRDSFERHLARCLECRSALSDCEALRETMSALPIASPTTLAWHRTRAAILREANRRVTNPHASRRLSFVAAAGLLAIGSLVAVFHPFEHAKDNASLASASAPAAPVFRIDAEPTARWRRAADGAATVIVLDEGRAAFDVAHLSDSQRFSVALPDGEVEVRGTRFVIDVAARQTKSVTVSSGRVALRFAGQNEMVLGAGDRWSSPIPDEAPIRDAGWQEASSTTKPLPLVGPRHRVADVGDRFGDAMARFDSGQFGEADLRLAAFIRDYPNDARCEDAAFLRAVARSRLGDSEGAAALAAKYLRAYPQGLRRAEAQHLIDDDTH